VVFLSLQKITASVNSDRFVAFSIRAFETGNLPDGQNLAVQRRWQRLLFNVPAHAVAHLRNQAPAERMN
jgi:hypothetical protein